LARAYRPSKRQVQQLVGDLFGLSISTGMISKLERQSATALEAPYNELATAVHTARVIHADETSWREQRGKAWLWVAVTAPFTAFTIARKRNVQVAQPVLGTHEGPVAVTDRRPDARAVRVRMAASRCSEIGRNSPRTKEAGPGRQCYFPAEGDPSGPPCVLGAGKHPQNTKEALILWQTKGHRSEDRYLRRHRLELSDSGFSCGPVKAGV
jgi:hypothetical protein